MVPHTIVRASLVHGVTGRLHLPEVWRWGR
jgi:hypothetical protein